MKKLVLLFFFFGLFNHSQITDISDSDWYRSGNFLLKELAKGKNSDVKGSPYLNNEYENGKIIFSNGNTYTAWDTGSVTNMSLIFEGATNFNQPLNWNTQSVTDMKYMFLGASSFDQNIGGWDTSSVTNMKYMLRSASAFSQVLCWDISGVSDTAYMFYNSGGGSVRDEENCEREQHMEQQQQCLQGLELHLQD